MRNWLLAAALGVAMLFPSVARADGGRVYDPAVVERWRPLVEQYDDWDADLTLHVMWCESEGNPRARNPVTGAKGLMQELGWEDAAVRLYGPEADLMNPAVNVGVAHFIWLAAGRRFGTDMGWRASAFCWGG